VNNVTRKRGKGKIKVLEKRAAAIEMLERLKTEEKLDVKVEFIQALILLGLEAVEDMLKEEVMALAGKRYSHGRENTRWGKQDGSVYLQDQKVPIRVQRIRSKRRNTEVRLAGYEQLQRPYRNDEQTFRKLLNGLSMHKYAESAQLAPEVFGINASSLSQRFKKGSGTRLRYLQNRRLDKYDFVAVFIDGKRFAEEGIVIALGITIEGKKVILGLEQMSTENHRATVQFFDKLIERGLCFEEGLLFIVDGSKGLIKAIRQKFAGYALIQRCQWHKRENVVSYLSRSQAVVWRKKLRSAYNKTTYAESKEALTKLADDLQGINASAAGSLREAMEETLTINKLRLTTELRKSFSSTNCIESVLSQVEQYTQRVDRWRDGAQIKRWVAAGLLAVEPGLKKVYGYRYLKLLRNNVKEELKGYLKEGSSVPEEQELVQAGV